MMLVVSAVRRLRQRIGLWTWLYLIKLLGVLLVTLPLLAVTSAKLDRSIFAGSLRKSWSFDVFFELIATAPNLLPTFLVYLLFVLVAFFAVRQLLNGGIYRVLVEDRPVSVREFAGECVAGFRQHIKISFLMIVGYVLMFIVGFVLSGFIPLDVFGHFGEVGAYGLYSRLAVIYAALVPLSILSDLLRLHVTTAPDQPLFARVRLVLGFYGRNGVKLIGVYCAFFIPFVIVWILIEKAGLWVTSSLVGMTGILLELTLYQFCSWLRTGQSLALATAFAPIVAENLKPSAIDDSGDTRD